MHLTGIYVMLLWETLASCQQLSLLKASLCICAHSAQTLSASGATSIRIRQLGYF